MSTGVQRNGDIFRVNARNSEIPRLPYGSLGMTAGMGKSDEILTIRTWSNKIVSLEKTC